MSYLRNLITPFFTVFFIFAFFYLFNFFLGPIPLSVNSTNSADLFTVSATGEAEASAQNASFTVGVTQNAQTSQEAQSLVNTTMNQILSEMKSVGVKDTDIKTENVSINPDYSFDGGTQTTRGYIATQNVRVKAPIVIANQAIDVATEQGANIVSGISFDLNDEDMENLEMQAREAAISKAKEKAKSLASSAGIRLGRLVNVVDYNESGGPLPMFAERSVVATDATQKIDLQPGENTVRVTVTLYYETL